MNLEKELKKHFGFDNFREGQLEIIESILKGQDTLAICPTSFGKTLLFQFPTIVLQKPTLVVSPLISLMKDQVDGLKKRGLSGCYLSAGMNSIAIQNIYSQCANGFHNLIYVAPERLETPLFQKYIKHFKLGLIVVDEAHCISAWGHGFRKSYQNIKKIRENYFNDVPIVAVTATAGNYVKKDIIQGLRLRNPNIFENRKHRENLKISVVNVDKKVSFIKNYLAKNADKCGIIYVRRTKKAELLAEKLGCTYYHGQMQAGRKVTNQRLWTIGEKKVIVCTHAFGMGIDKGDVRFVIHIDLPETIEAYVQEIGRGGRDGGSTDCIFLTDNEQMAKAKSRCKFYPDLKIINNIYHYFCNEIGDGGIVENVGIKGINQNLINNTLDLFFENDILSFEVRKQKSSLILLKRKKDFNVWSGEDLEKRMLVFKIFQLMKGKLNERKEVSFRSLDVTSGKPFLKHLRSLKENNYIDYNESKLNRYLSLKKTYDKDFDILKNLKEVRGFYERHSYAQLISYLVNESDCRNKVLAKYFDADMEDCGDCDNCKRKK